jgi:HSP20 family protein
MNKPLLFDGTYNSFLKTFLDFDKNLSYLNTNVPKSDVYETESSWYYKMSTPGVNMEDLNVTIENNTLTVRGEIKSEVLNEKTHIYHKELKYGSFSRSFALPDNIIADEAVARLEKGITIVEIPKKITNDENHKVINIPVNIKSLE